MDTLSTRQPYSAQRAKVVSARLFAAELNGNIAILNNLWLLTHLQKIYSKRNKRNYD